MTVYIFTAYEGCEPIACYSGITIVDEADAIERFNRDHAEQGIVYAADDHKVSCLYVK